MEKYDVLVIGGGPGGYVAAIKAAQMGKKSCLVEQSQLGGVCLNRGCIPTKTILESIEVLNKVITSGNYGLAGFTPDTAVLDLAKVQARKRQIVGKLTRGVEHLLKSNGVRIIQGQGSFVDSNSIAVGAKQIVADNIIIATGSSISPLSIPISREPSLIGSDEALDVTEVPTRIVIIGGGVIGLEFAYIFRQLGSNVTVLEMAGKMLPTLDEEVSMAVTKALENQGIVMNTAATVTEIIGNKVKYRHLVSDCEVEADKILVAVGRVPNTEGLNLDKAGVEWNQRGIVVDSGCGTNVPGIYAIGDVNGKMMLAHTAMEEAVAAVENICGGKHLVDYSRIPQGIFTQPEIASVGLSERDAREKYGKVNIGRFPFSANGKSMVEGKTTGFIKVVTEQRYNEVLGVHIFGNHATELIGGMSVAIGLEATAKEVAGAIFPHPTVSETIPEAFRAVLGRAIHA